MLSHFYISEVILFLFLFECFVFLQFQNMVWMKINRSTMVLEYECHMNDMFICLFCFIFSYIFNKCYVK